jgi:antitoxin component YwqK of YwqJK toxin-antitoxin module
LKIKYFLLLLIILSSCKDDISNQKFRNENYVFYQEDGKAGEWQKINPELEKKLPKSHSTYFFPNGNRFAELKVIDSFPNRILKYFNTEDKLIRTVEFKSDSMVNRVFENGNYKDYHSNLGLQQSEGLIENHLYQGKWKFYHKDGETIKQIVEYVNDTLNGVREDYWENGNLKSAVNIINGKHNGSSLHHYENGDLEEKNNLKNGELHGSMVKYYKNKNIESERKYWNGELIDSCKSYYENGQLKLLQFFDLDTITMYKSGTQINYHPNGKLKAKASFSGNKSSITIYHENGTVQEVSEKINDKHHGLVTVYHENGQKSLEGIAKSGYYDGGFKYFDKSGKLIKTVNYGLGQPIDSIMH